MKITLKRNCLVHGQPRFAGETVEVRTSEAYRDLVASKRCDPLPKASKEFIPPPKALAHFRLIRPCIIAGTGYPEGASVEVDHQTFRTLLAAGRIDRKSAWPKPAVPAKK